MKQREIIVAEIITERAAQDQQWGGSKHDDHHGPGDWCSYIDKQRRLARDEDEQIPFEMRMIKIAALAVAAIESSRRQR